MNLEASNKRITAGKGNYWLNPYDYLMLHGFGKWNLPELWLLNQSMHLVYSWTYKSSWWVLLCSLGFCNRNISCHAAPCIIRQTFCDGKDVKLSPTKYDKRGLCLIGFQSFMCHNIAAITCSWGPNLWTTGLTPLESQPKRLWNGQEGFFFFL